MFNIVEKMTIGVWILAFCSVLIAGAVWSHADAEKYAREHNCVWDSNGMCYTEAERPYLFK